jgi:uncharacterized LabA/DUF88 family protein
MATDPPATTDRDPADATLIFHEQADGRKVSRLPGGKIVLVDLATADRVRDGDAWFVRLRHRDTFAIADPVEKVTRATWESTQTLSTPLAEAMARAAYLPSREPAPVASRPSVDDVRAVASTPAVPPSPIRESDGAVEMSRIVRPADRVAFFIDGANTDGASRYAGYFIDFLKAREFFLASGSFYAGFYYVADFAAADGLQQSFFDFLSHAGYIVRRRRVKVIIDEDTGERIYKGNLDTEIVLDMMNTVDNYDVAFLFSGDSDFERAVDLLRARGKRLYVVTARAQLSRELAYIADKPIIYLEDHRTVLARRDRGGSRAATEPAAPAP